MQYFYDTHHKVNSGYGFDQYMDFHAYHRNNNADTDYWSYPVNQFEQPYYDSVSDQSYYDNSFENQNYCSQPFYQQSNQSKQDYVPQYFIDFMLEQGKVKQMILEQLQDINTQMCLQQLHGINEQLRIMEQTRLYQEINDFMLEQGNINQMILDQLRVMYEQLDRSMAQREAVNYQCSSSYIFSDEEDDDTLYSGTQIDKLYMPAESDSDQVDSTHLSTIQTEFSPESRPQPNLMCDQLDLQIDDTSTWHSSDILLDSEIDMEAKEIVFTSDWCSDNLNSTAFGLQELGGDLSFTPSKQDGFKANNTSVISSLTSFPVSRQMRMSFPFDVKHYRWSEM